MMVTSHSELCMRLSCYWYSDDFRFGEFLAEGLSNIVLQIVDIPVLSWLCLIPLIFCVRPVFSLNPLPFSRFLLAWSGVLLLLNMILHWRLESILNYLTATDEAIKEYLRHTQTTPSPAGVPVAPVDKLEPLQTNGIVCSIIRGKRIMSSRVRSFIVGFCDATETNV